MQTSLGEEAEANSDSNIFLYIAGSESLNYLHGSTRLTYRLVSWTHESNLEIIHHPRTGGGA